MTAARALLLCISCGLSAPLLCGAEGGCGGPAPDAVGGTSRCEGTALPCTSYFDPTCNLQDGCAFSGTDVWGDCVGSATPCDERTAEDTCLAQEGCSWR